MAEDARITAYIERAAPFAQPLLRHIRQLVHAAVPDAGETIKWGMPFFDFQGRPLAMMAAFKAHAGFGIFDGTPMPKNGDGMGQFGKLTAVTDLPAAAELTRRLAAAAALIAAGQPSMRPRAAPRPALAMPDDLALALAGSPDAAAHFRAFPPGAQREYVEWVLEAKQPATRARRIATTVEWSAAGKRRNWKYESC
ncbi:MAG: hypothetical protein CFE37_04645 [Alphaproteobacteria bacterium PA4]|nr:MAG: hypothetical protein CFE37_04645 [Alphaproteobacteria bacterium PA4]